MDQRTARNVVVAIIGFVAVGIAAATIRIPSEASRGSGGGEVQQQTVTPSGAEALATEPLGWFLHLIVILILIYVVTFVLTDFRRAVLVVVAAAVLGVILYFMFEFEPAYSFARNTTLQVGNATPVAQNGSLPAGGQESTDPMPPVWWLWAPLLGFLLLASAFLFFRSPSDSTPDPDGDDYTDEVDPRAIGDAAGDAADRIQTSGESVDNEVYRAWVEMTDLLDAPHPRSGTPGEFAEAAVEAGLRRSDVEELTELFEEVRYGNRDPQSREERAVDVLRRIESSYADGMSDGEDANGWWRSGGR